MTKLEQIRAGLKEKNNKTFTTSFDTAVFPFWNIAKDSECVLRFLPDKDENNINFWVEKAVIKLPFAGIKGSSDSQEVIVQVPCMHMYGKNEVCPILSETKSWFNDPALEPMARVYWKKRTYLYQGFVVDKGSYEETKPDSPIRRFIIGPQLQAIIEAGINDPELDEVPNDYVNGIDFRLVKGVKGTNADYTTSSFKRKSRPLTSTELSQIEEFGLFNLADFLPKKPGIEELAIIKEMFEASVNGERYDNDRWGKYYKPTGSDIEMKSSTTEVSYKSSSSSKLPDVVEYESSSPVETTTSDSRAADILNKIRNR